MKLLVIADDDSFTKALTNERADVLISCGDIADEVILQTAQAAQCGRVFAVKGNHDGAGPFPAPILDLHLRTETLDGLTFGGFHGSWRYKPRGRFLYDQDEVADSVAAFPAVDVFVAHNSPRHVHDIASFVFMLLGLSLQPGVTPYFVYFLRWMLITSIGGSLFALFPAEALIWYYRRRFREHDHVA
jgi:hypothetical protein